jgi:uncharacterized membrane protein YkvI
MGASDPAFEPYWMKQKRWADTFPAMPTCDALAAVNVLSNEQMKQPTIKVDTSTIGPVLVGFAMFMFASRLQSRHRYVFHASSRK